MPMIVVEELEIELKRKFLVKYSKQAAMHTIRNFGRVSNGFMQK